MRRMKKRGPNVLYDLNDLLFFLTNIAAKFEVRNFTRSGDNSDFSFGWRLRTPNIGEKGVEGWEWYHKRALVSSYRPRLHSTFCSIFTRCQRHFAFVFPTTSRPIVSPKISPRSPGSRWMAFGLGRTKVLGQLSGQFVSIVFKISDICDPDPPTLQTDRP